MGWKEAAAGLGTEATVRALRAAKGDLSKRDYKRLIATAVAQILEEHPDFGPRKARKRARRLTGARPSKKLIRAGSLGLREGAQSAAAAVVTAGLAKVVGAIGGHVADRFAADDSAPPEPASTEREPEPEPPAEEASEPSR